MRGSVRARGELVEVAPDAWDELLDELGLADAYLQRDYVEAACVLDPGRPAFLHAAGAGGDVVFPCIVRAVPDAPGRRDVTTPYGYGGPVASGHDPPAGAFYALYEEWCGANGVVTTFIRFHPLFENQRYAGETVHLERLANTATWPLDPGLDLFAGMHSMHRRGCRKAQGANVAVTVEPAPARLDDFVVLYEDAMRRQAAESFYLFPPAYWELVGPRLRDRLVRFDAAHEGELVASILCLATPPWLHYHLGATAEQGRSFAASKLLFYEAARWGQAHGFREFHLGSGLGGREDSLWWFKQRFSGHPGREFWIGKLVHDPAAYRALAGGAAGVDGFFPAYRAVGAGSA